MKWLFAILLASGGLFWLLHDPAPSEEDVVGLYDGTYKGYVDYLELTRDHLFSQVLRFPNGETMQSSGTWKLTSNALDLDGYIFFIDEQIEGSSDQPMKTSLTFAAHHGMLIRDWGTGFYKLTQQESYPKMTWKTGSLGLRSSGCESSPQFYVHSYSPTESLER